jgi:hypothetical protein
MAEINQAAPPDTLTVVVYRRTEENCEGEFQTATRESMRFALHHGAYHRCVLRAASRSLRFGACPIWFSKSAAAYAAAV